MDDLILMDINAWFNINISIQMIVLIYNIALIRYVLLNLRLFPPPLFTFVEHVI